MMNLRKDLEGRNPGAWSELENPRKTSVRIAQMPFEYRTAESIQTDDNFMKFVIIDQANKTRRLPKADKSKST
jgi:hypothetical protein